MDKLISTGYIQQSADKGISPPSDEQRQNETEQMQGILAAIVNNSEDAIISKTLQGYIISWNAAAHKMFGYTADEAIGKHISLIIPPERIKEEEYIIGQVGIGKKVDHFETVRVTKYGTDVHLSITVSPVMDSSGRIIGASKIARDITAQKLAREAADRYIETLQNINSLTKVISAELDLNKILQNVTDVTTKLTGARFGAFFYNTINTDGEVLMLYTLSGAPIEAFEKFGTPRNTALFHPTFSGEDVVRVDDVTLDPRYGKNPPHIGMPEGHLPVISYLAVPVISRSGTVIGGLIFGHPEAAIFTQEHELIVSAIASQAAIGIDNAKLYSEIKALNEKKDEFIGLASHELKTPLTSISGYLQILERLNPDGENKKFTAKTIQQVKKLSVLVSDLLDVSKIEAGKLQFAKMGFDIKILIDEAVELIQHSNKNYRIIFETDVKSCTIYGDPQRIEQVIINLLTNAIKYSPSANEVIVSLICTSNDVQVSVQDFGMGIAADHLKKIFSRFYRVDNANSNISGLGIGLYLSGQIIERHDGQIWAESVLGEGSTFWFSIPLPVS